MSARSSKMAKEGATRKHLAGRSWKFVRNADVNILSPTSTAAMHSVEHLNPFDGDCLPVVNGNPGTKIRISPAKLPTISPTTIGAIGDTIDAIGCSEMAFSD